MDTLGIRTVLHHPMQDISIEFRTERITTTIHEPTTATNSGGTEQVETTTDIHIIGTVIQSVN